MMLPLMILSAILSTQSHTATPAGFTLWPRGVPPSGIGEKDPFGNHTLSISHRDKDGLVEVHEGFTDVIVVQTGSATLVVGGTVDDPQSTGPGEVRGKSIVNGVTRVVRAGDVIHIPAGTPHQFFIAPGSQITYFLVKIAAH